jgi:hyperosmotically inducible periplasmic protein
MAMSKLKATLLIATVFASPSLALAMDNEAARADTAITARVKTALIRNDATKAREINVETEHGIVQLSGFVDSEQMKAAATSTAEAIPGVQEVRNELIVRAGDRTVGHAMDDAVIAAKVKSDLSADAGLATAVNVNVEVRNRVVQLSGFVSSTIQKQQAERIARRVAGVTDVRNSIAIEPPPG